MYKVYKPKGDKVEAVQVTVADADKIAKMFFGRVKQEASLDVPNNLVIAGVEFPTFEGPRFIKLGDWIVRDREGSGFKTLTNDEFNEMYEPARVTRAA